ncbi:MAG: 4-alpha-glucanotransferase [Pirellulales bacterium]|nr:4-alpha-glucanotransferase [Pirellulales bacterium]
MNIRQMPDTRSIDAALRLLGIRRFALAIHDSCFPSTDEEDIGRGSPYSRGGLRFLRFARSLGFNAIQLGPQGKTGRGDPSPYNSCIFSKSILSLAALTLADEEVLRGLVSPGDLDQLLSRGNKRRDRADRVGYAMAWDVSHRLLEIAHSRFRSLRGANSDVAAAFQRFLTAQMSARVDWFERDGAYEALAAIAGSDDWQLWGRQAGATLPLDRRLYAPNRGEEESSRRRLAHILRENEAAVERFAFGQFLLHVQHERLRAEARNLGLLLFGDMHVGCSHRDWWSWRSLFLPDYLLGAPPSRTNPPGQPWGYPVLDPRKIHSRDPRGEIVPGSALEFVRARAEKLLAEFDGLRIDHPQGLVCPWVYRADDPDSSRAVQNGARLYSSPDLPDHPELRQFSLVRPDQLNPDPHCTRYADDQVVSLLPEQIDRFAVVLDAVLEAAKSAGRMPEDILCEVLSTWPAPLKAVMKQWGMGRFCITQKADPRNPRDVYRAENTSAADWIMAGNHDTKPLRPAVEEKSPQEIADRSRLLAQRLVPEIGQRHEFAARIAADPRLFCEAMFAELFLGPAKNVSVFFADLFGERQTYNLPGTVGEDNWTLRIAADYEERYARRLERGEALNLHRALALALEAKAGILGPDAASLARQLRNGGRENG